MKLSNAVIRWAKTLKDYDPKNETMRSFGRRNNINSHQGSYWYKKFREDPKYQKAFMEICKNPQDFNESPSSISLSSIECIEITPPTVTADIIIERKDWKIHLPGDFSSENLKKIVAILGEV